MDLGEFDRKLKQYAASLIRGNKTTRGFDILFKKAIGTLTLARVENDTSEERLREAQQWLSDLIGHCIKRSADRGGAVLLDEDDFKDAIAQIRRP